MVMPGLQDGHIHDVMRSDQKTCDLEAAPLTRARAPGARCAAASTIPSSAVPTTGCR